MTLRFWWCHPVLEGMCLAAWTHPVKHWQHHVQLLLLFLLSHVPRRMAQLSEEPAEVHQSQGVVLRAALLLPWAPHDPLHHVHLGGLVINTCNPAERCSPETVKMPLSDQVKHSCRAYNKSKSRKF